MYLKYLNLILYLDILSKKVLTTINNCNSVLCGFIKDFDSTFSTDSVFNHFCLDIPGLILSTEQLSRE